MQEYKKYVSYILYILSVSLVLGFGIFVVFVSREFILAKEGIGVYGALIYYAAALLSVALWGISYLLSANKRLAIIFWLVFVVFTVFIATQPTWWAAPSINS